MIATFKDQWLQAFFQEGTCHPRIPSRIESALARKLDILNAATSEADLRVPPGNRFEHLEGKLKDWCSIRVNKQYRLIFRWDGERALDIYLDPHSYR